MEWGARNWSGVQETVEWVVRNSGVGCKKQWSGVQDLLILVSEEVNLFKAIVQITLVLSILS